MPIDDNAMTTQIKGKAVVGLLTSSKTAKQQWHKQLKGWGFSIPGLIEEKKLESLDPRKIRNAVSYLTEMYSWQENAASAKKYHQRAKLAHAEFLENLRKCGCYLRAVKKQLDHGEWLDWLKNGFGKTERTAQLYMSLDRYWDEAKLDGNMTLRKAAERLMEFRADPKRAPKKKKPPQRRPKGLRLMGILLKENFTVFSPEEKSWLEENLESFASIFDEVMQGAFSVIQGKIRKEMAGGTKA